MRGVTRKKMMMMTMIMIRRMKYCERDLLEGNVKKHEQICKKMQEERVVDRQTPLGADRA